MEGCGRVLPVLFLCTLGISNGSTLGSSVRSVQNILKELVDFVRVDDAQDRAETDGIIGMASGKLRSLDLEASSYEKQVQLGREEMNTRNGRVAASGALRDALMAELSLERAAAAMFASDCAGERESASTATTDRVAQSGKLGELMDELLAEKFTAFEKDPCALEGEPKKELCNNVTSCADPRHCSFCVYDDARKRCFTAVATQGDRALKSEDVDTAVNKLRSAAARMGGEESGPSLLSCAAADGHQLRASEVNASIHALHREVERWKEIAELKKRQLLAAEPVMTKKKEAVTLETSKIEQMANTYQARRNARVSSIVCTISRLRKALAGASTDEEGVEGFLLLPGPELYPGATVPATNSSQCDEQPLDSPPSEVMATYPTRDAVVYRGGATLEDRWAQQSRIEHSETARDVDVDLM